MEYNNWGVVCKIFFKFIICCKFKVFILIWKISRGIIFRLVILMLCKKD